MWRNVNALPNPPQWLFGVFRRPLIRAELKTAYDRAHIWASDAACLIPPDWPTRDRVALQLQSRGGQPAFIQKIARWIREIEDNSIDGIWEDKVWLVGALWPARQQPLPIAHDPDPPFDIPFTLVELKRMYGQNFFQALTPKHLGWPTPMDRSSSRTDKRRDHSQEPSPRDQPRPSTFEDGPWSSR